MPVLVAGGAGAARGLPAARAAAAPVGVFTEALFGHQVVREVRVARIDSRIEHGDQDAGPGDPGRVQLGGADLGGALGGRNAAGDVDVDPQHVRVGQKLGEPGRVDVSGDGGDVVPLVLQIELGSFDVEEDPIPGLADPT